MTAYIQFSRVLVSDRLKKVHVEAREEWSELSDEEKEKYVRQYEVEHKLYSAQMEEYREGGKYEENRRRIKVLRAKIKEVEEGMSKPKGIASNAFTLFLKDQGKSQSGKSFTQDQGGAIRPKKTILGGMWHALTEEEQMEYKARWGKLKLDWQREVARWEEENADNPKMAELRAYKDMLKTARKRRHLF